MKPNATGTKKPTAKSADVTPLGEQGEQICSRILQGAVE